MTAYAKAQSAGSAACVTHGQRNFILQQGFSEPSAPTCELQYSALMFQPRLLGLAFLAGALQRASLVFFGLGAVLWWCALVPRLNPFDALYNWTLAPVSGISLTPAQAPRRFSQFLGGSVVLAIGFALATGHTTTALVLEVVLLAAVLAVVSVGFCLGSLIFHVLRGRIDFARRTLPWAAGP